MPAERSSRLVFALLGALLTLLAHVTVFAGTLPSVKVESAANSSSTDPCHPVMYAYDGDLSTAWRLTRGAIDGRAELTLSAPILVDGIRLTANIPDSARLELELFSDGRWIRSICASLTSASLSDDFIDLSFERVVTKDQLSHSQ